MEHTNWFHEVILGALLGNIALGVGFIRFLFRIWKYYEHFMERHEAMYADYCRRNKLKVEKLNVRNREEIGIEN